VSERASKVSRKIPPKKVGTDSAARSKSGKTPRPVKKTSTTKSAKGARAPKAGKTTRIKKKGGRTQKLRRHDEQELEPITPFKRGISLGVKLAAFTAAVVGFFMVLQGYLTFVITAREMDAQITRQGQAIVRTLEKTIDRGFWMERQQQPEQLPDGTFRDPPKQVSLEELETEWERRLKEIHDSDDQIITVAIINVDSEGKQYQVVQYPTGTLSVTAQREVDTGEESGIKIFEGNVGEERVRRFDKEIALRQMEDETRLRELLEQLEVNEKQGEDTAETLTALVELTGKEDMDSYEQWEHWWTVDRGQLVRREESQNRKPWVSIFVRASALDELKEKVWNQIVWVTLCGGLAGVLLTVLISALLTGPVRELEGDITAVAQGDLGHQSRVRAKDEIGALAHVFNIMTRNLRTAQTNAIERQAFERELNIAKEIQEKLLPERIPAIPGFDIHSHYNAAKEVGGDYYDFIVIDQTHLGIIVADVAGKGIPGAMVMTMARSLVRLASVRNISPGDTFKKVNRILAKDIRRGMFVTAAYMVLNVKTRQLKVASAGHNPVVLWRAATGENELIKPAGIALGFDKGTIFDNHIKEVEVQLEEGDRICTYTDGVNEAMNNDSEEFGDDRFYTLVKSHARKSSKDFVEAIVQALDQHRGGAEQSDDITITTLGVTAGGGAST
jgi:serine phosphatase RsbU (regulator of sigma subunit)